MIKFFKVLGLSILEALLIIIVLITIVRLKLPITGTYITFGITAVVLPLVLLLIHLKLSERETLFFVPLGFTLAALYSLAVSLYSYYGGSSFSSMFHGLMYFIYFLPSVIYCGLCWIFFSVIIRVTRDSRR
jgi:hypothetical protein